MGRRDFDLLVRDVDEVPLFGSGRARRVARRKRIVKNCATLLALVLAAGGVFIATQRSQTSAVTLDDVIRRFQAEARSPARAKEPRSPKKHEKANVAGGATEPGVVMNSDEDATDVEAAVAAVLPEAGVYSYRTTGGERISLFGAHHDYPARTYATIRHLGGCHWEARNDVVAEHTDIRTLCNEDKTFLQTRQERQVSFFGRRDGRAMRCDPPLVLHRAGDAKGTKSSTVCSAGEGSSVRLRSTFLGLDTLTIGSERVEALHVLDEGICEGDVEGTSMDELWLHPESGLTLKWRREVDTRATAFGGAKVRYQEEATFLLESLDPQG